MQSRELHGTSCEPCWCSGATSTLSPCRRRRSRAESSKSTVRGRCLCAGTGAWRADHLQPRSLHLWPAHPNSRRILSQHQLARQDRSRRRDQHRARRHAGAACRPRVVSGKTLQAGRGLVRPIGAICSPAATPGSAQKEAAAAIKNRLSRIAEERILTAAVENLAWVVVGVVT